MEGITRDMNRTPPGGGKNSCVNCDRPDSADNFVQCDHCDSWWHMSCAGVTDSVSERHWTCRNCIRETISSRTATSSVRAARAALQLQHLNERHVIEQKELEAEKKKLEAEKKFLNEKFQLMQAQLDDPDGNESNRSRVSRRQSHDQVKQWVRKCADQDEGAVGYTANDQVAASQISPSKPRDLSDVTVDNINKEILTAPMVARSLGNTLQPTSPLKHPALPNQLQRNPTWNHQYQPKGAIPKVAPKMPKPVFEENDVLVTNRPTGKTFVPLYPP